MKKCLEPTCGTWMNTDLHDYCWQHEQPDLVRAALGARFTGIPIEPWYRRNPAPRWVSLLAGALMFFAIGVVVGYGAGLMR